MEQLLYEEILEKSWFTKDMIVLCKIIIDPGRVDRDCVWNHTLILSARSKGIMWN